MKSGPGSSRPVPDVTRLLDRMAEMQLIERERSDADRRLVRTFLTPKGLALVNGLDDELRAGHRRRLTKLDRKDLTQLVPTLAEVRAGI